MKTPPARTSPARIVRTMTVRTKLSGGTEGPRACVIARCSSDSP